MRIKIYVKRDRQSDYFDGYTLTFRCPPGVSPRDIEGSKLSVATPGTTPKTITLFERVGYASYGAEPRVAFCSQHATEANAYHASVEEMLVCSQDYINRWLRERGHEAEFVHRRPWWGVWLASLGEALLKACN